MSVPALALEEASYEAKVERGFLIIFRKPSVFCDATGHRREDPAEGYFECPTIRHVPGAGYEQHAFESRG